MVTNIEAYDSIIDAHLAAKISKMATSKIKAHKKRGFKIQTNKGEIMMLIYHGLKNPCPYCGGTMQIPELVDGKPHPHNLMTLEVVNPSNRVLSKENIVMACERCNKMKGPMDLSVFFKQCKKVLNHLETMDFGGNYYVRS